MIRFGALVAGLTLASSMAFAGTPLPFGPGGFVPPDSTTTKVELGVAKNLGKLSAAISKCHAKGAGNVFKLKPSGVAACDGLAVTKYNAGTAKLVGVACVDPTAQTALGGTVAGLVQSFDSTIWCAGTTPLGAEFAGGFVAPDSNTLKAEALTAGTLIKHSGAIQKCSSKGVSNLTKAKPDGYAACAALATTKTNASLAKIAATAPACLTSSPLATAATVEGLTLSFNPAVLCASPSGAFLN